jgi:hypothetical protein
MLAGVVFRKKGKCHRCPSDNGDFGTQRLVARQLRILRWRGGRYRMGTGVNRVEADVNDRCQGVDSEYASKKA